jgi:uncharacterized membrane protein
MTDERAALLITAYANGLRRELELLGASETTDLVSEVVSMLRDACEGDPEVAAAEIENLGPPEEMARTILEQRGLKTGPGTPAAAWWRLGIAAPIDIIVGFALPVASALFALSFTVVGAPASENDYLIRLILGAFSIAAVGLTGAMAWGYWKPWRTGGTRLTVGMRLAGISVVRVGGTRTVALTSDLQAAGLAHDRGGKLGSIVTLVLAVALLTWAGTFIIRGADTGLPNVEVLAGDATSQEDQVRGTLDTFYGALIDPTQADSSWPSNYISTNGMGAVSMDAVLRFMRTPQLRSYTIGSVTSTEPGVWRVAVDERRVTGLRRVLVTMGLRMAWGPDYLGTSWVVVDYKEL